MFTNDYDFLVSHNPYLLNKNALNSSEDEDNAAASAITADVQKIHFQPSSSRLTNRYAFHFYRESPDQLKEKKRDANRCLDKLARQEALEIADNYFTGLGFPKRPHWTYEMSKEQLDHQENRYFRDFMQQMEKSHYDDNKELSYCELNLETWRQLWRVLELSDIVLVIVDVRSPSLMFPPALYDHVADIGKEMILVLNKCDLVTPEIVCAWRDHFISRYPRLRVIAFTSFPGQDDRGQKSTKSLQRKRRMGKRRMAVQGACRVYETCREIVKDAVDLSSWRQKLDTELVEADTADDEHDELGGLTSKFTHSEEQLFNFQVPEKYQNGVLTVGCVGFPNAGKSSLMNALMGRKVVSVSRTPGHTKHFQTIFLTETVRICDCPGLVFPSRVPRPLQVLIGSFPIAQLREPYGPVRYLAERVNLPGILNLDPSIDEWSPVTICEEWATKRGFLTAKTGRPDTYRAANNILRMALDGKIVMALRPRGFFESLDEWPKNAFFTEIQAILDRKRGDVAAGTIEEEEEEDDSDSTEDGNDGNGPVQLAHKNPFQLLDENE